MVREMEIKKRKKWYWQPPARKPLNEHNNLQINKLSAFFKKRGGGGGGKFYLQNDVSQAIMTTA
jgi:hypothetical protein